VRALLDPRSIALIGASADAGRLTARAQRYLRRHGYTGALHLVNPRHRDVLGEPAVASLDQLAETPDLAFILLGTDQVEAALEAIAARRIPVACILADGFAEAGEAGAARQARLLALARAGGVRLLGPNSMGVVNLAARTACCVNAVLEAESLPVGRLALVSQSGSMLGALMSRGAARGIGFSHLLSTGNEADITADEATSWLLDEDGVDAVLLFLEAIRAPEMLAGAAAKAHRLGKPLIAFKLGRSPFGAELAASHTGALAGQDAASDAFLRAHGILRATTLESFLELPALVLGQRPARRARAVSVLTTTGGGGALAVDALGLRGIEARPPDATARAALEAAGIAPPRGRLLDMTLAGTEPGRIAAALAAQSEAEDIAAAVAVIGSSAQFRPQDSVAGLVAAQDMVGKPMAAFLLPEAGASLRLLAEAGIAAFRTPESLADALSALLDWRAPQPRQVVPAPSLLLPERPDEADAREVFAALGLASAWQRLTEAPVSLAFPVALKILSPDLAHKSEIGGVALNIADEAALRAEAAAMRKRVMQAEPKARLTGFLVQSMARGLAEAILGFRRDPEIGPIVLLGAGGILAELHRDMAIRLAPCTEAEAREMVEEVRGLAPIRGYRNLPRGDVEALVRAIQALSRLAVIPGMIGAEINPLIIGAEGVVVADAWVVRG
jgi:acyl-CoA synthetase (NDP forming)